MIFEYSILNVFSIMELTITTKQTLKFLEVLSWIIFIALCVEAGAIIVNTLITTFINPKGAENFWEKIDFTSIYEFDKGHFLVLTILMSIVAILKAILFYLIIKLFTNKNLSFSKPFNSEVRSFILNLSYLALGIGIFSNAGARFFHWLTTQGIEPTDMQELHLDGADVWIFMAVIFFVIAQLVKRGIEIQTENDLTV